MENALLVSVIAFSHIIDYRPPSNRSPKGLTNGKRSPATLGKRSPILDGHPFHLYQSADLRRSGQYPSTSVVPPELPNLSGTGSYRSRSRLQPQEQQLMVYKPIFNYPIQLSPAPTVAKEKNSRPTSRSASRGESFKNVLGQLQVHPVSKSPSNSSLEQQSVDNSALPLMPFNVLPPNPCQSHSESSSNVGVVVPDQLTVNTGLPQSYPRQATDSSPTSGVVYEFDQTMCLASMSNPVQLMTNNTTVPLYDQNHSVQSSILASGGQPVLYQHSSSGSSGNYCESDEMRLQEAQEVLTPPQMFADGGAVTEIPVEMTHSAESHTILNLQGQVINDPVPAVASEMTDNCNDTGFETALDSSSDSKTEVCRFRM